MKTRNKKKWLAEHGYEWSSLPLATIQKWHEQLCYCNYPPRLQDLFDKLPKMSYLHDYLIYSTGNEAPEMFHVWGGFMTLSAAVARKVWLPFEDEAKFPNLYVMLVGDAGNGKSHAMAKAKRLLAEIDAPYSGSLETPPGMWRYMTGNPMADPPVPAPENVKRAVRWPDGVLRDTHAITIIANEFINFISLDQQGWVSALNDIYDQDRYHYRTKNMGEDSILGPYICLIGALTTEVSSDLQKARIISTGLARRTLFQYGQRQFNNPHPKPQFTPEQREARSRCIEYLKKLNHSSVSGAFSWTPGVNEWWTTWYKEHLKLVPTKNPNVRSWYATKADQMLKLAMLTSLSEDVDLILKVEHFELAHSYLTILEEDLPKIFGGVGRNELAAVAMKMVEYLGALDTPIPMQKFQSQFFSQCRPPHDFDQCLNHMLMSDLATRSTFIVPTTQVRLDLIAVPPVMQKFAETFAQQRPEDLPE